MEVFQIQDNQNLIDETVNQGPIFSFLEAKVQQRYNDATRAKVEKDLMFEHAKRRENITASKENNLNVSLLSQKLIGNEYVLYEVKVQRNSLTWVFQTRFSLLLNLHERLNSTVRKDVSAFPEKKYFGNLDAEFLAKRYNKLELYLQSLFVNKDAHNCQTFKDFLRQSKLGATFINDPASVSSFNLDY